MTDLFCQMLSGNVGLMFTNEEPKDVRLWFENYHSMEYARAGFVVPDTINLEEGECCYLFLFSIEV